MTRKNEVLVGISPIPTLILTHKSQNEFQTVAELLSMYKARKRGKLLTYLTPK